MDHKFWSDEPSSSYRLFNPKHHIVTSASFVVTKVVIKAHLCHPTGLKKCDDLLRPEGADPPLWCRSFIIQKDAHCWTYA